MNYIIKILIVIAIVAIATVVYYFHFKDLGIFNALYLSLVVQTTSDNHLDEKVRKMIQEDRAFKIMHAVQMGAVIMTMFL